MTDAEKLKIAVEALTRISYAKADQLDHSIDVAIIGRCAQVASAALRDISNRKVVRS